MEIVVRSVDYAPAELDDQTPFVVELLRQIPGSDRPDYWLGALQKPLSWIDGDIHRQIDHLIICARWQNTQIQPGISNFPIGIAYVVDSSQIDDAMVDFEKTKYVAIGIANDANLT